MTPESTLQALTAGLWYLSETDAPWTVLTPDAHADITEWMRAYAQLPADTPVSTRNWDTFLVFAATPQPWHTPEEQETARRYAELRAWISTHLHPVTVTAWGHIQVHLFLAGQTTDGQTLVLYTRAVET
ncbi:MAG: nuclease A inhibitor family protein [Bacteroidia bacterium]|nr:nuclease A inhibitor family protein [Bacteroidia bacterium]